MRRSDGDLVTGKHFLDGLDMPLRDPMPLGVFIDDGDVVVFIAKSEEDDRVMVVAVVHGSEPFDGAPVIDLFEDVGGGTEGAEVLAGSDIPAAIVPGFLLPAGAGGEGGFVFGIGEAVVIDTSRDEPGGGFGLAFERDNKVSAVPFMADAAGVGGGIDAWPPSGFGSAAASLDVLPFA